MKETLEIYTAGICLGNPGPGAGRYIVYRDGVAQDEKAIQFDEQTNFTSAFNAIISAIYDIALNNSYKFIIYNSNKVVIDLINKNAVDNEKFGHYIDEIRILKERYNLEAEFKWIAGKDNPATVDRFKTEEFFIKHFGGKDGLDK